MVSCGADGESRTPVSTLGRSHNSRYTTPAFLKVYHPCQMATTLVQ